jgi:hypothetical protein
MLTLSPFSRQLLPFNEVIKLHQDYIIYYSILSIEITNLTDVIEKP